MTNNAQMSSTNKINPSVSSIRIINSASKINKWSRRSPFLRYGLPLVSLTVFGSVGLAHLITGSKEVTKEKDNIEWELLETTKALSRTGPMEGYKPKKFSLEEELKMLQERIDIYNYEYRKIPRPQDGKSKKP